MKSTYTLAEVREIRRAANLAGYTEGYGKGLEEGIQLSDEAWEKAIANHAAGKPIFTPEEEAEQQRYLSNLFASMFPTRDPVAEA